MFGCVLAIRGDNGHESKQSDEDIEKRYFYNTSSSDGFLVQLKAFRSDLDPKRKMSKIDYRPSPGDEVLKAEDKQHWTPIEVHLVSARLILTAA